MITTICGLNGSGKSLALVSFIHRTLCARRPVLTNLLLLPSFVSTLPPDIREWVEANDGLKWFRHPLDDREGGDGGWERPSDWQEFVRVDTDEGEVEVYRADGFLWRLREFQNHVIVIDEAQTWFASKVKLDARIRDVLGRHRGLSVDVIFAFPGVDDIMISPDVRRLAGARRKMVNLGQVQFLGPIYGPQRFVQCLQGADGKFAPDLWVQVRRDLKDVYLSNGGTRGMSYEATGDEVARSSEAARRVLGQWAMVVLVLFAIVWVCAFVGAPWVFGRLTRRGTPGVVKFEAATGAGSSVRPRVVPASFDWVVTGYVAGGSVFLARGEEDMEWRPGECFGNVRLLVVDSSGPRYGACTEDSNLLP